MEWQNATGTGAVWRNLHAGGRTPDQAPVLCGIRPIRQMAARHSAPSAPMIPSQRFAIPFSATIAIFPFIPDFEWVYQMVFLGFTLFFLARTGLLIYHASEEISRFLLGVIHTYKTVPRP